MLTFRTDDMDKKLLLTIQSECNAQNINLPWTEIGLIMGHKISGGAVVQHLAKLRTRMVAQGLSVPPPLKRGGGSRISTGPSIPRTRPSGLGKSTVAGTSSKKSAAGASKRRAPVHADSDDSEDEGDFDDNSSAEYGKPPAKRSKTTGKKHSSSRSETGSQASCNSGMKPKSDRIVAAGAPFLALEDDQPKSGQMSRKTVTKKPSLVVTLDIGANGRAFLKKELSEEDSEDEESEDEESRVEGSAEDDHENESMDGGVVSEETALTLARMSGNSNANAMAGHYGLHNSTHLDSSTSHADHRNTIANNPMARRHIGLNTRDLGGLPTIGGFNVPNNYPAGLGTSQYVNEYGAGTESGYLNNMMFDDGHNVGYGTGDGAFDNHMFGHGNSNVHSSSPYVGDFDFEASELPFTKNTGYSRQNLSCLSTDHQHAGRGEEVVYSAEDITTGSATVGQTPSSAEADHCNGFWHSGSNFYTDGANDEFNGSHFEDAYDDSI